VQLLALKAGTESEIDDAFETLAQLHAGALVIGDDPFFRNRLDQLAALASHHVVPAISLLREFTVAGGLISYGTSIPTVYHQKLRRKDPQRRQAHRPAGPATDQIRARRQSQDRQNARLTIPQSILAPADEVIE
jgi:putative tryptophan/tyrosine transport system substrate-binding protein